MPQRKTVARRGTLEVILGPMFAGKSTALTDRFAAADGTVFAIKPAFDTRYDAARIVTHDGRGIPARPVSAIPDIPAGVDRVLVDEVQFFEEPVFSGDLLGWIERLRACGVDVVACGLDLDWRGEPFKLSRRLEDRADIVTRLTSRCSCCGRAASMTFKKVANGSVVELGEADLYEARCPEHWSRGVLAAADTVASPSA